MTRIFTFIIALALFTGTATAASNTTFTYQGDLQEAGSPANGSYTMIFDLWDALAGGSQVGSSVFLIGVSATDGLFAVELDFSANVFDGTPLWLEITVGGTTLAPRQPITSAPFSIQTRGIFVGDNDNVGIGTTTPDALLKVTGDAEQEAISGNHTGTTGFNSGVRGESASTSGFGVRGRASAVTGQPHGVSGQAVSPTGIAVYGSASSTSGLNYGGYFRTGSTSGTGVYGRATATSGFTYGAYGQVDSPDGFGVYGYATADTGTASGVYGRADSPGGYAGYFQGGQNYFEGNVGIGTSTPGAPLVVVSDSAIHGIYCRNSGSYAGPTYAIFGIADADSGPTIGVYGRSNSPDGTGLYGIATGGGGGGTSYGVFGMCQIASGYDFYAGGAGTNYGSSSSRRWKRDVRNIDQPLDKLAQLRGVYFNWDKAHGGHHDVGMIAEEVGAVLPEIVNYEANGIDAIGMDYSKLTPLLVEAVNELRAEKDAEIDELKQQINDLQRMIEKIAANAPENTK